jgi:hypothetical protein
MLAAVGRERAKQKSRGATNRSMAPSPFLMLATASPPFEKEALPIYLSELGCGLGFNKPCRDLRLWRVTFPMT